MKRTPIKPKVKKCTECGTEFMPFKSTDKTCPDFDCKTAWALKVVRKHKSKKEKEERKETRAKKIDLMSVDEFRSKYLQPCINKIARLIDYGQPCIATGNFGKMAGGHFFSVGSNRTTALNLHNIHIQCFESNGPSGGDPLLYREGIKSIYGSEYLEFMEETRKTPKLGLNLTEIKSIYLKAKIIENRLLKSQISRSSEERINMRNEVNVELGIYSVQFSVFGKREPF